MDSSCRKEPGHMLWSIVGQGKGQNPVKHDPIIHETVATFFEATVRTGMARVKFIYRSVEKTHV